MSTNFLWFTSQVYYDPPFTIANHRQSRKTRRHGTEKSPQLGYNPWNIHHYRLDRVQHFNPGKHSVRNATNHGAGRVRDHAERGVVDGAQRNRTTRRDRCGTDNGCPHGDLHGSRRELLREVPVLMESHDR
ncbi:hypothetical protein GCM10009824_27870 [Kocuria atrinae]|uniref:Uncharacterized protein n=1 Tax=Kocuria atrinae TaxID=592377 RepID=A0ABN2Y965_9MICC